MASYILASGSPRRKQLLEWAEIDFEVVLHPTDESYPEGLEPAAVAEYIARQKGAAVLKSTGAVKTVIAADTIVVLQNEIIGKPKNKEHALSILKKLSGQQHQVITGVYISDGSKEILFHDITEVQFYPLTEEGIRFYIDKYKPYDKAGAYAIQEWIGVTGIKSISGDFYNVMGLPVSKVVQIVQQQFP